MPPAKILSASLLVAKHPSCYLEIKILIPGEMVSLVKIFSFPSDEGFVSGRAFDNKTSAPHS